MTIFTTIEKETAHVLEIAKNLPVGDGSITFYPYNGINVVLVVWMTPTGLKIVFKARNKFFDNLDNAKLCIDEYWNSQR